MICILSITFVTDDEKAKVELSTKVYENQKKLTRLAANIYFQVHKKKLSVDAEFRQNAYTMVTNKAMKEVAEHQKLLESGKTKEQLVTDAGRNKKLVKYGIYILLLAVIFRDTLKPFL